MPSNNRRLSVIKGSSSTTRIFPSFFNSKSLHFGLRIGGGEWGVGSGEWGQKSYFPTPHSPFPTPLLQSAIGNVTSTIVPANASARAEICPPCLSIILLAIARPSDVRLTRSPPNGSK